MQLSQGERRVKNFIGSLDGEYSDLILYSCGIEQCKPLYLWSLVRDFFVIHYIISGAGTFNINEQVYSLKSGNGFVIHPGYLSSYQADADNPWKYCWVAFGGSKAGQYLERMGLNPDSPIFSYNNDSFFENLVCMMLEAHSGGINRSHYLTGLLFFFFSKLEETSKKSSCANRPENRVEEYLQSAIEYISKNYPFHLSIEDMAKYIGISRKYLCSLFSQQMGLSPQQYLIKYRIDKACILLAQNNLSVRDVSHSVGYEDQLNFSKIFKKIKGISPSDFRKCICFPLE